MFKIQCPYCERIIALNEFDVEEGIHFISCDYCKDILILSIAVYKKSKERSERDFTHVMESVQKEKSVKKEIKYRKDFHLEDVELSVRLKNKLKDLGIKKLSDLNNYAVQDLFKLKGFGRKTYLELSEILNKLDVKMKKG